MPYHLATPLYNVVCPTVKRLFRFVKNRRGHESWYSRWDSNPYYEDFKSSFSASWNTGASIRLYLARNYIHYIELIVSCKLTKCTKKYLFICHFHNFVTIQIPNLMTLYHLYPRFVSSKMHKLSALFQYFYS